MRWWTISSRITKGRSGVALFCLFTGLLGGLRPARAQETIDQRFQQAVALYNSAHADEACERFRQIEKEKPDYPPLKVELSDACRDAGDLRSSEDKRYNDGQLLLQQGKCDEAKAKFEGAAKLLLVHPKHKVEIADILKSWDEKDKSYQKAVNLSKQGRIDEARGIFNQLASAGCPRASAAKDYLARLANAVPPKPQTKNPPPVVPQNNPETTPADQGSAPSDQLLRDGLQDYFEGKYDDTERNLSEYLQNGGKKQGLAYFFRGASHSTRFFVSGEKEVHEKQLALEDFRAAKEHAAQFRPPDKYVSPKILALYSSAVK
jgi:tetratricopeptide (TPR) repeat protein